MLTPATSLMNAGKIERLTLSLNPSRRYSSDEYFVTDGRAYLEAGITAEPNGAF
jgi:hypothetical protein